MNLSWDEGYTTNIPELDTQHKRVLELISQLAFSDDLTTEKALLKEILHYTIFHFISETELLKNYSYPQLGKQKEYQQAFIDKLSVSIGLFSVGSLFKGNLLYFLKRWFEKHITYENRGFYSYISSL